jgi:hypothetical protein
MTSEINKEVHVLTFNPRAKPYVVFSIIFLPQAIWTFAVFILRDDVGALLASISCGLFWLGLCLWVFDNLVSISSIGVTHGRFIRRSLDFSDAKDFYVFVGFRDDRNRTGPFVRLVVEPKRASAKKAIIIPLNLFSVSDQDSMTKVLSRHLPQFKPK